ncbi:MAG: AAA family ATPase [Saprospiraceae bacterium]
MKHLIPYFIQRQWQLKKKEGRLTAYTLFIDLKGFTPLTEGLMREGASGAERLSLVLNEIFEPLVQLVYARGGFIPYFAGDAFTAIFPVNQAGQNPLDIIATAAWARKLFEQRENQFDAYTIGLKFGLSYGEVSWGIVGNTPKSFYFKGIPIDNCAWCQTLAGNQEIVIDGQLMALLPNHSVELTPVDQDAYRVDNAQPTGEPPIALACDELDRNVALRFLPEAVVDYRWQGEFRPVASIFLSFEGPSSYKDMDKFASVVLQLTDSFSGYLKEIDFGDKGGVLTLFFGAPTAFENNVDRALAFVLNLRDALHPMQLLHGWKFKAGVTVGTAYTGIVGGYERCQYACVGNRVNLAARLMTNAQWGDVLVDEEVQQTPSYRFVHTGNIPYKGIQGNVPTYKLLGRHFNPTQVYEGAFISREEELAGLITAATPLLKGKNAGVSYVFGEAGIGKSRLVFELQKQLLDTDKIQWITCQADQILHKPFNPFVHALRHYFACSTEESEALNRSNFEARFQALTDRVQEKQPANYTFTLRELERIRPVLAALVGLNYEDSLWEMLDAKGRYQHTIRSIIDLLLVESQLQPLVIAIEDAHWMDDSSVELLQELVRLMPEYPVWLLVTSRFGDDGAKNHPILAEEAKRYGLHWSDMSLNALTAEGVRLFAEKQLNGTIAESFLQTLLRTTNNNPFYLEQMLEYFLESGLLVQNEGEWTIKDENIKLSNSINAILTARIDRLSEQVRETVKAAAVIGREFEVPVLSEVMRHQGNVPSENAHDATILRDEIKTAEEVQIWMAMNELRYIFRHSLLREAVYNMQLGTRLRQLHKLIAEAIERLYLAIGKPLCRFGFSLRASRGVR